MAAEMEAMREKIEMEEQRAVIIREYNAMQEQLHADLDADESPDAMRAMAHP